MPKLSATRIKSGLHSAKRIFSRSIKGLYHGARPVLKKAVFTSGAKLRRWKRVPTRGIRLSSFPSKKHPSQISAKASHPMPQRGARVFTKKIAYGLARARAGVGGISTRAKLWIQRFREIVKSRPALLPSFMGDVLRSESSPLFLKRIAVRYLAKREGYHSLVEGVLLNPDEPVELRIEAAKALSVWLPSARVSILLSRISRNPDEEPELREVCRTLLESRGGKIAKLASKVSRAFA